MSRAEMLLYHGLDNTGSIEISTTSAAGPWTKITLTSTQGVSAALAEWTTLANAALPAGVWSFTVLGSGVAQVRLSATGGGWIKLGPCLMDALGYTSSVVNGLGPVGSDKAPLGLFDRTAWDLTPTGFAVGLSFPLEVEEAELTEYRAGRATAHHYGRAAELTLDLYVPAALWDAVDRSPLLSGHAAMLVVQDDETAFGESNFDGSLTLYPIETVSIEQDSPDDSVWIRLRCTMDDPA